MNKLQTAQKMALTPILAAVVSTLTYKYITNLGLSAEVYTASLVSLFLGVKDLLKYQFKLFGSSKVPKESAVPKI